MAHRVHAEFLEGDLLHLAIGGVVVDPVLVAAEAVARLQHRRMLVGHHRQLVEPAAGQRAQPLEMRRHLLAQAGLHVEPHQVLELAVDRIEVLAVGVGRDVVRAVRHMSHVGHVFLRLASCRLHRQPCVSTRVHIGRHGLGRGTVYVFVEQALVVGRLEVQFDRAGARRVAAHMQHEARGGIDLAGRADRQEQAAALQHLVDFLEMHRHLAEPDDVGPQFTDGFAVRADEAGVRSCSDSNTVAAGHAADLAVAPVHVDHPLRSGLLVQQVDVLGDDRHFAFIFAFEPRQRPVRVVRVDVGRAEQVARLVVEVEHLLLVAVPGLDGRDLFQVDARP